MKKTYQKFLNDKDERKNYDEDDLRYYKTEENDYNDEDDWYDEFDINPIIKMLNNYAKHFNNLNF